MAKVYTKTDEKNRIIAVNSDIFLSDLSGWTILDEGRGDRFVHASGNYFDKPLTDENGVFRYKYENGEVTERSCEEMAGDIPEPAPEPPSNAELAQAITELAEVMLCG